ncbi:MAG: formate dehydrogenase accessory sulfurtransferase FdhD [Desulfovermiculus sp.]
MNSQTVQAVPVLRYQHGGLEEVQDQVVREELLEIRGHGHFLTKTLRLPGEDQNLVLGWCHNAGLISCRKDIQNMQVKAEKEMTRVEITLASEARARLINKKQDLESTWIAGRTKIPKVRSGRTISIDSLFQAREVQESRQKLFGDTGGTHCAALFAAGPRLLALAEDVGRHNALDKVIGRILGTELDESVLLVLSSRLNSEMVGKAVMAKIPIVAGASAPTEQGVFLAERAGMTLIGFLRPGRFNLYTHSWRVT